MTPETRAEILTELIGNLIDVLERENAILDKPRSVDLGPVVAEKVELLQSYENQLSAIAADPAFAINLDEAVKVNLRDLSKRFEEIRQENERKLRLAVTTSNMIVDRIKEAATKAAGASLNSYGKTGTHNAYRQKAAPVAINETL